MSTYTIHPHERHPGATGWSLRHPLLSTVAVLAAAVAAGVLIAISFHLASGDAPAAQHRAGGHALATVTAARQAAEAPAGTAGIAVAPARTGLARSPARGGFAVGRTAGAADGFIVFHSGVRAPARGGFSGRSPGAGEATGDAARAASAG